MPGRHAAAVRNPAIDPYTSPPQTMLDPFWLGVTATILLFAGAGWLTQQRGPEPGTLAYVDQCYREGEISLAAPERRKRVGGSALRQHPQDGIEKIGNESKNLSLSFQALIFHILLRISKRAHFLR